MNHLSSFCLLLFIAVLLSSCEKVIDIDLEGSQKMYVIEAVLTDHPGGCRVSITQTRNFDEDNNFPGISEAVVSITDNSTGITSRLAETSPGLYTLASLVGEYGKAYTLQVAIGEKTFTSRSVMPQKINIDSVYVTHDNMFGEVWKLVNIDFQDPPVIENSYRFIQHINGVKTKEIYVRNDDLVDGKLFTTKLYMDPDTDDENKLKAGDTVLIEMQCIDKSVYKYWYSLDQGSTGESNSASPANPVTNIEGGALGYFSAQTVEHKSITVKE